MIAGELAVDPQLGVGRGDLQPAHLEVHDLEVLAGREGDVGHDQRVEAAQLLDQHRLARHAQRVRADDLAREQRERERGGELVKPPPIAKQPTPSKSVAPRRQTKLSYKDERRAAELEELVPRLTIEIEQLEHALADPAAFARNAASFEATAARLQAARSEREAAEAEWLEIELRREALSGEG